MPKITVEIEWDWPDEPSWLNAGNIEIALASYCENTAFTVMELTDKLSASEALFAFASWRLFVVAIGESTLFDLDTMADIIDQFSSANNLVAPRSDWAERFIYPVEEEPDA